MAGKRRNVLLCSIFLAVAGLGCAHVNNPWEDSSVYIDDEMKTTSSEAYAAGRPEFPREIRRVWGRSDAVYENGSVTHWPLWFEDPFEDRGNRYQHLPAEHQDDADNQFALNWVDYLHIVYGPSRLLVNTVGWPVSAAVTPPGMLMESDGRLSRNVIRDDHDARRSDGVSRDPPHLSIINRSARLDEPPAEDAVEDNPGSGPATPQS